MCVSSESAFRSEKPVLISSKKLKSTRSYLSNSTGIVQKVPNKTFPPKITQFQLRVECWRCITDKTLKLNLERFAPLQWNLMIKMKDGVEKEKRKKKEKNRPFIRLAG